jgi:ABC-type nitrate/sulfonate/bicarbonate transport system permease component
MSNVGFKGFVQNGLLACLSIILIFAAWKAFVVISGYPAYIIAPPEVAIAHIWNNWAEMAPLLRATLYETFVGYILGSAFGFAIAVLMAQFVIAQRIVYPGLIISQSIPIVAIAAPLALLFGFGMVPKLIVIGLIVFFPVAINVLDGLSSVDRDVLNLARVLGASPWRIFTMVKLPACIGPLFTGLKIGASYAVTGAVIGEWTASSTKGLGTYLLTSKASLNTAAVYGDTLLLTVIGVGSFVLMLVLGIVVTPWQWRATAPKWLQPKVNAPTEGEIR